MIIPGYVSNEIVLDTNAASQLFFRRNPYPPALQWFNSLHNVTLVISSITINELMYAKPKGGLPPFRKRDIPIVRNLLANYQIDYPTPQDYVNALNRVDKLYGVSKLGFADALIAECAMRHKALLCSCDNDFKVIPGLQFIQPYPCP